MSKLLYRLALVALSLLIGTPALAVTAQDNIYRAEVLRVIDGDTVLVRIAIWPDLIAETRIRQRDIDTPETRGKCKKERALAEKAKEFTSAALPVGTEIDITRLKYDKFGGRYDGNMFTVEGKSLALLLVDGGLARPYDGGKRKGWCR
jgi:endonuclease YncB( thermonuclease family)